MMEELLQALKQSHEYLQRAIAGKSIRCLDEHISWVDQIISKHEVPVESIYESVEYHSWCSHIKRVLASNDQDLRRNILIAGCSREDFIETFIRYTFDYDKDFAEKRKAPGLAQCLLYHAEYLKKNPPTEDVALTDEQKRFMGWYVGKYKKKYAERALKLVISKMASKEMARVAKVLDYYLTTTDEKYWMTPQKWLDDKEYNKEYDIPVVHETRRPDVSEAAKLRLVKQSMEKLGISEEEAKEIHGVK